MIFGAKSLAKIRFTSLFFDHGLKPMAKEPSVLLNQPKKEF